jgi:formylglycine-generating enzyme required for sulfatase activity
MVPARVASMLVARFSESTSNPDSTAWHSFGDWEALKHSVLEKMARPADARVANAKPLMPPRQVLRHLLALARQFGVPEADMRSLRRRVAHAEPFWPLPWVEPAVEPREWLVVVDADPSMAVFLPELNALCDTLAEALGRSRLRLLWMEPEHADAQWHEALRLLRGQAVSWVLLSDMGLRHAHRRAVWTARLRRACDQGERVQVVVPCLRAELTGLHLPPGVGLLALGGHSAPTDEAPQLDTLLAAASPFLTIDRALLRKLRVALCPGSSPLLEQQVWQHPDFDQAITDCKWKPQHQAAWLARLGEQLGEPHASHGPPASKIAQVVWEALCQRETSESPSQHLLQCWLFGEHAGQWLGAGTLLPGARDAWLTGQQYFDDLSKVLAGLESDRLSPGRGVAPALYAAASLAHGLLRRMPGSLLARYAEQAPRLRLAADLAQLVAGHPVEPVDLVDDSLLVAALQPGDLDQPLWTQRVALVQRGHDLWLQRDEEAVSERAPLGGIVLARGTVQGRAAALTLAGQQKRLTLSALPIRLGPAALVKGHQALRLAWPGGQLEVVRVQRPLGAQGWQQTARGLALTLPPLPTPTAPLRDDSLMLRWPETAPAGQQEAGNTSTILLTMREVNRGVGDRELRAGLDQHGVYLDLFMRGSRTDQVQRLRWIEPGSFLMGATADEHARLRDQELRHHAQNAESPLHEVRLTQGYWLADTPCTQWLWEAVLGKRPPQFGKTKDGPNRPVEGASWDRVQGFLAALQKRLPSGWEAALPTEAQWEYAARAGTQTAYWWGDEPDSARANWDQEQGGTTPVDRYEPNPWGLYDVHGNVLEWCHGAKRKYDSRTQVDPADAEHRVQRVLRGGSWHLVAGRARAAYRIDYHRDGGWLGFGFRLLLRLSSQPTAAGPQGRAPGLTSRVRSEE